MNLLRQVDDTRLVEADGCAVETETQDISAPRELTISRPFEPRPYRWRGGLSPHGRAIAHRLFALEEHVSPDKGHTIRGAVLGTTPEHQGRCIVLDPVDCDAQPNAWRAVTCSIPPAPYHRWRVMQVLANQARDPFTWHLPRDVWKGCPGYLVGSGHSAPKALDLPTIAGRRGKVLALNRGAELLSCEMDAWYCHDAMWSAGDDRWRRRLLGEWSEYDFTGAHGLFNVFTASDVVDLFLEGGGVDASFCHGLHANPYRDLVEPERALPSFVEGIQGTISAIHVAAWLGLDPILLIGIDQAMPLSAASEHYARGCPTCGHEHGRRVGWRTAAYDADCYRWAESDGVGKRVVSTCDVFVLAARHVAALAMWYADAGTKIYNLSDGLDFVFAPHVEDHRAAIARAETGRDLQDLATPYVSPDRLFDRIEPTS